MEFEKCDLTENSEVFKEIGLIVRDKNGVNHAVTIYVPEKDMDLLKPSDSPVQIIETHKPRKLNRQQLELRVERLNKRNRNIVS